MADTTTHEALRALLAEAKRAEAVMLRECGMGVLDKVVLEQASAVLAAADAALSVQAEPVAHAEQIAWLAALLDSVMDFRHTPQGMVRGGAYVTAQSLMDAAELALAPRTPQPPAPVPAAPPNAAEIDRLRAALDKWETTMSAVMPADYKDWHESDRAAWPDLAASCIVNARRMAKADGRLIAALAAAHAALVDRANNITGDNHA